MAKWADYVIVAVRYDDKKQFIEKVQAREDEGEKLGDTQVFTRKTVVDAIQTGTTFVTGVKKTENGKTVIAEGESVGLITVEGTKYLRTDKNKTKRDNLENLPAF